MILKKQIGKGIEEIKANKIIYLVNRFYQIDCRNKTRKRKYLYPRQEAMYLIGFHTSLSLAENGKLFNGRDHATALHSINEVKFMLQNNFSYNKNRKINFKIIENKVHEALCELDDKHKLKFNISNLLLKISTMEEKELINISNYVKLFSEKNKNISWSNIRQYKINKDNGKVYGKTSRAC